MTAKEILKDLSTSGGLMGRGVEIAEAGIQEGRGQMQSEAVDCCTGGHRANMIAEAICAIPVEQPESGE